MRYRHVFVDTNVLLDLYDTSRPFARHSRIAIQYLLENEDVSLYTSCDIITTLYYVYAKKNKEKALDHIIEVNQWCTVIEFGNKDVAQSCQRMKTNPKFTDLEDTIQFIMAQKIEADLILSNDGGFFSEGIEVMDTKTYCTHAKL